MTTPDTHRDRDTIRFRAPAWAKDEKGSSRGSRHARRPGVPERLRRAPETARRVFLDACGWLRSRAGDIGAVALGVLLGSSAAAVVWLLVMLWLLRIQG